jgi:hypothetical protein
MEYRVRHSKGVNRTWAYSVDTMLHGTTIPEHRILQTGYLSVGDMERMSTQLATQRSWNCTIAQGLSHGRTTGDTFFLTPSNAGHFSDSLRRSDLSTWRFLDGFSRIRFLLQVEYDSQWVAGCFDTQSRTLYLETAMGQVSRDTSKCMWRWVEHTRTDARDWTCRIASLETCSSPQNAAIYTWSALWPQSWDERPTGETVLAWRVRAYQYAMKTVPVPYHLDRISVGEMQWLERQICDSGTRERDRRHNRKFHGPLLRMYVRPFLKDRLERSLLSLAQRTKCR